MLFMPLIVYESAADRIYPVMAASAIVFIMNFSTMPIVSISYAAIFSCIAALLAFRTSAVVQMEEKIKQLRDNSAEYLILMKERNRSILNEKDNQIHLAKLRERNRIAREIHDNVGHMLSRSILQTAALQVICTDENIKESLSGLNETLNTAMTDIRRSVHDLHDESIDMKSTIHEMTIPLSEKEIEVIEEYNFGNNIPNKVKLAFIGIAKESISNIIKHSNADKVTITINDHPAFYQLVVKDNGRCGEIKDTGIGLENIRNRAESLNGLLKIDSNENGFRIFLTVRKEHINEDSNS